MALRKSDPSSRTVSPQTEPSLIERITAGAENMKMVSVPIGKQTVSVGLIILSRALEVEMVVRAREWCAKQSPPITGDDLVEVETSCWLLWKSLVDPASPFVDTASGRLPKPMFASAEMLRQSLPGDLIDWLDAELAAFRKTVSPFTSDRSESSLGIILSRLQEEATTAEGFVEAFKVVWCSRHGKLLTEPAVRKMSPDQWLLIFHALPDAERMELRNSPLMKKVTELADKGK